MTCNKDPNFQIDNTIQGNSNIHGELSGIVLWLRYDWQLLVQARDHPSPSRTAVRLEKGSRRDSGYYMISGSNSNSNQNFSNSPPFPHTLIAKNIEFSIETNEMSVSLGPDPRLDGRTSTYNRDEVVRLITEFYQSGSSIPGINFH